METLIYFESYYLAWGIYLIAGAGVLLAWWQVVKLFKRIELRLLWMALMAIVIFTPWHASEPVPFFAPAVIVAAFDFLDGLDRGLFAALMIVLNRLLPMILAILLVSIAAVVAMLIRKETPQPPARPE